MSRPACDLGRQRAAAAKAALQAQDIEQVAHFSRVQVKTCGVSGTIGQRRAVISKNNVGECNLVGEGCPARVVSFETERLAIDSSVAGKRDQPTALHLYETGRLQIEIKDEAIGLVVENKPDIGERNRLVRQEAQDRSPV